MNKNLSTKEIIFKESVILFSKKGFNGTSISDITKKVGITKSSLYNHFKNKDELFNYILDYFEKELNQRRFDFKNLINYFENEEINKIIKNGFYEYLSLFESTILGDIWIIISNEQYINENAFKKVINETNRVLESNYNFLTVLKEAKKSNYNVEEKAFELTYVIRSLLLELSLYKRYNKDTGRVEKKIINFINSFSEILKKEGE